MTKGMIRLGNYDVDQLAEEFVNNSERFHASTVRSDVRWSSLTLYGLDEKNSKTVETLAKESESDWTSASSYFPKTVALLRDLGYDYRFVVLQKLEPQGRVETHTDPSDGHERHFLYVQSPPGFTFEIGGKIERPSNGDLVVIDPALPHRAVNDSDKPRYQIMFYADKTMDK